MKTIEEIEKLESNCKKQLNRFSIMACARGGGKTMTLHNLFIQWHMIEYLCCIWKENYALLSNGSFLKRIVAKCYIWRIERVLNKIPK